MTKLEEVPSLDLNDEQRKRFTHALEQYLNWLEQGVSPDLDHLLKEHPDLADAFKKVIPNCGPNPKLNHCAAESLSLDPNKEDNLNRRLVDDKPPRQLGDFELFEEIGRGGMGIVFRARQKSLDRIVAVKILPNAATWDGKQIARFHKEAQAAAQLNHPNIVSVYSVGNESETYFYSMPFIDGISLEGAVRRFKQDPTFNFEHIVPVDDATVPGSLNESVDRFKLSLARNLFAPSNEKDAVSKDKQQPRSRNKKQSYKSIQTGGYIRAVVEIVAQAAEALHYAHQHGIIHRDVKPSNLILDRKGNLWITDFGLAMMSGCKGLTGPGDIMGTLKYMSPEQASGKTNWIDERSDVYSLGVTMYELLTLHAAVEGDDRMAMLKQIKVQTPPSARKRNPGISKTLENILLKAISKFPEERYPTAAQFAEDLRLFLSSGRSLANRPGLFSSFSRIVRRNPQRFAIATIGLMMIVMSLAPATLWLSSRNATLGKRLASVDQQMRNASNALNQLGMPLIDQLRLHPGTESLQKQIGRQQAIFLETFLKHAQHDSSYQAQIGSLRLGLARLNTISMPDPESLLEYQRVQSQISEWLSNGVDGVDPSDWFQVQHELASLRIRLGLFVPAVKELKQFLQTPPHGKLRPTHQNGALACWEAILRLDLGLAFGMQNSYSAAEQELTKALALLRSESDPAQFPSLDSYCSQELVTALLQNANLEITLPELGQELIQNALKIANASQGDQVMNAVAQRQLGQCFLALGLNNHRLGRNEEALIWFRKASRITSQLVKNDPSNFRFQCEHATATNSLGQLEFAVGNSDAARLLFQQAVHIFDGISRLHSNPAYRSSLASALHDLATVAIRDNDTSLARSLLDRAIAEQQAALLGEPDNPTFQRQLQNYEQTREGLGGST